MKVLFAINNDNVSEAIAKKYQKDYKEILSYKNVYYFNAILRELQRDKSYSRVVISEDLEPFANNNYDSIDKFLYEKYSNISKEIKTNGNGGIDIILICADRRKMTDDMIVKIYKEDIYNGIVGQDRTIDEVCRLINSPRDKEEAKRYYNIQESDLGEVESENSVSEAEVENIRAHYARLGKNEDKYVDSFNNIVAQYTDNQLRIIIKYLPMNVKAVLEARSPKYQQLAISGGMQHFDAKLKTQSYKDKIRNIKEEPEEEKEEDEVLSELIKPKTIKQVVIPTSMKTSNVQKVVIPDIKKPEIDQGIVIGNNLFETPKTIKKPEINIPEEEPVAPSIGLEPEIETSVEPEAITQEPTQEIAQEPKRGRGRPRKTPLPEETQEQKPKRGRGRPRKTPLPEEQPEIPQEQDVDLFNIEEEKTPEPEEVDLFSMGNEETTNTTEVKNEPKEVDLFNIDEDEDDTPLVNATNKQEEVDLFNLDEKPEEYRATPTPQVTAEPIKRPEYNNYPEPTNYANVSSNFNTLLTADKKIVAFVGTTKNGTSFVVNNTAEMLATMGINTAILDMTKTKNAYYIYTNNEESLRNIAKNCMEGLQNGITEGLKIKKNLTVYTEMPGEEKPYKIDVVLSTLLKQYSAILIDTDFDTDPEIFARVQEIYLVQTMDVLTIQPLTAFLRNLKSKGVLQPEKLKIVINKSEKVRSLGIKTLIGGMSCYNAPNMSYMTELFDKDNIRYCEIPFEEQNYVKYLDSLVNCSISLNGYTKTFMQAIREVANMVYPLISRQNFQGGAGARDPFSSQVNDTLNKMKRNY